jgi:hypothetical protein
MTKEQRKRINTRLWKKRNKDKVSEHNKAYNKKNRSKRKLHSKKENESRKHKPLVYLIESYNYVGVTENLYGRLSTHRTKQNRETSTATILAEFETRREALDFEKEMHNAGYEGGKIKKN